MAAVLAELYNRVPDVSVLRVFEVDDTIVGPALSIAGLGSAVRFHDYEVSLRS
ncbi:hypothetical protein OHA40_24040 [Nocardia sp. NBC_00508]|uniref:hypothetical protein n=1 Tax=Nocardia sp. NBC_00508 TaxID=2975992 RepID=UPI002E817EF2|nr:hypothetical protein [Nocardia sp. NBC_00508]WUD64733.1 hypothetical protein OHA40_24040 [Nocardia sp. NBC_00508]